MTGHVMYYERAGQTRGSRSAMRVRCSCGWWRWADARWLAELMFTRHVVDPAPADEEQNTGSEPK